MHAQHGGDAAAGAVHLPGARSLTFAALLLFVLQIEHHLFPAISFMHYPAISKIVEDEANKRGLLYAKYDTLPQIIGRFTRQVL